MIASLLQEAERWLAGGGRALWPAAAIGHERILQDTSAGLFHVARDREQIVGVMKFELEDAYFWPEIPPGSSAFIHKLAIRRAWAKQGVSTELLAYARTRAEGLGRAHLRLDCVADRQGLRKLYEDFGFTLHSVVQKGATAFARYELPTAVISAQNWKLYSPDLPAGTPIPEFGEALVTAADPMVLSGHHADGYLLPEACFKGWQFGVLQERLLPSGLQAFVRLPSGDECSLVWDRHGPVLERLQNIKAEPGYLGAFRVRLQPSIGSRSALVQEFKMLADVLEESMLRT